MAGAKAERRSRVEREFRAHAVEVAAKVAEQFQPVYERALDRARAAEERAAILQTCVERIALGSVEGGDPVLVAQLALDQLGIVPDVQTLDGDSTPHAELEA